MNSVCGATVSKIEDINSAMMPVVLISLASFYLGYMTSITASGSSSMLQKLAIYLPFSSPFAVPFKLLNGDIPASDLDVYKRQPLVLPKSSLQIKRDVA